MKKMLDVIRVPLTTIFLFSCFVTAMSFAADGPGGRRRGNGGRYSVAEPAAIVLLGTGLISLGLYAKRKRRK